MRRERRWRRNNLVRQFGFAPHRKRYRSRFTRTWCPNIKIRVKRQRGFLRVPVRNCCGRLPPPPSRVAVAVERQFGFLPRRPKLRTEKWQTPPYSADTIIEPKPKRRRLTRKQRVDRLPKWSNRSFDQVRPYTPTWFEHGIAVMQKVRPYWVNTVYHNKRLANG